LKKPGKWSKEILGEAGGYKSWSRKSPTIELNKYKPWETINKQTRTIEMKTGGMPSKGISPVIATVIIVAVAIAISIAVAGWLYGLWGGFAGGTPQIQVSNVIVKTDGTIDFYYVNSGSGSDRILRVDISNGTATVTATLSTNPPAGYQNDDIIEANERSWIRFTFTGLTVSPGDTVNVVIYFEKSGQVTIPATVRSA
jgi:flagellin-like protein